MVLRAVVVGKSPSRAEISRRVTRPLAHLACAVPLLWLAWHGWQGGLGVNPIETTNRFLGDWALRLLVLTLAVSPIRELCQWPRLMAYRRLLGLWAFAYAALHVMSYVVLDQFFDWAEIWADVLKRGYITAGAAALLLLLPLALTSTKGAIKRLGAARWRRLHWLIYPAAALACLHHGMMVKADLREPLINAAILALLLGYRLASRWDGIKGAVPFRLRRQGLSGRG